MFQECVGNGEGALFLPSATSISGKLAGALTMPNLEPRVKSSLVAAMLFDSQSPNYNISSMSE